MAVVEKPGSNPTSTPSWKEVWRTEPGGLDSDIYSPENERDEASFGPIAGSPIEHVPVHKKDRDPDTEFKNDVQSARSVEALNRIIEGMGIVQGSRAYSAAEVVQTIKVAQNFLDEHLVEIIAGVINRGNESFRESLGKKVNAITNGGPLGIREKVRELMKEQMQAAFRSDRKEMVSGAVEQARDFTQLYEVIGQFTRGVNVAGENKKERITAEETIRRIEATRGDLAILMRDERWLKRPMPELERELDQLVAGSIPKDSAIDRKVFVLLLELIREQRLTSEAGAASASTLKRWGKRLIKLFR